MIVAEYVTASGVRVAVDDSYTRKRDSQEELLAVEEQRRIAREILMRYAEAHIREGA